MGKETFILRTEWIEDLELLTMSERGELLTMLMAYANGDEASSDSKAVQIVFRSWRRFIDACDEKWEQVREERRENGKKGGAPKGNQNARKKQPKTTENNQNNQMVDLVESEQPKTSKTSLSVSVSDSVSVSVSDIVDNPLLSDDNKRIIQPEHDTQSSLLNPALRDIIRHYERMISPDMSAATISQLKAAADEWPAEVVISAIDAAVDSGKRNGSYVSGVLRGYRAKHIRTMEDVNRERERHRAEMDAYAQQKAARAGRTAGMLPTDDLAQCFRDGKPVFRDAVDEYLESMQEQPDEQKVITAHFPPFKGAL